MKALRLSTVSTSLFFLSLLITALGASSVANAAMVSRLGGAAVYDTDFNISWLANANVNGLMDWATANTWAAGLNVDGISGWRLPNADPACGIAVNGCTNSEMGHLFYDELGGVGGNSILTTHNANLALFQNVQANGYWSPQEYAPNTSFAWAFFFNFGVQDGVKKTDSYYAWAVHAGDVGALVPVPAAVWLFGSGLLGLVGVARRKKTLAG